MSRMKIGAPIFSLYSVKNEDATPLFFFEVPESQILSPETDKIMAVVCTKYKVSISDLRISIRGQLNEPRNVAMYLMRHLRGDTLSTICKEFGLKIDSSAGSIVDRVKKQILKDKQFRNKVAWIKKIINKS